MRASSRERAAIHVPAPQAPYVAAFRLYPGSFRQRKEGRCMTDITDVLGARFPIIQAPMAGGPNTAALVCEVSRAGGLGSIAAAYLSAQEIDEQLAEVRAKL